MNRLVLGALALLAFVGGTTACREDAGANRIAAATVTDMGTSLKVTESFSMPLRTTVTASMSQCDNSPGPFITLAGEIALAGLGTRFTFSNNVKGTHEHTEDGEAELVVVPAGESITIPKQPVEGGVGGNPFIWLQFQDGSGTPMTDEIFLGRCVQGTTSPITVDLANLARAIANVAVADCANSPGPFITMDGALTLESGVDAAIIFRNNDNPVGGPHKATADAVARVELLPPGQTMTFEKQPVLGGVGGNPWIFFQFLDGAGAGINDEVLLGRCEQLSHA